MIVTSYHTCQKQTTRGISRDKDRQAKDRGETEKDREGQREQLGFSYTGRSRMILLVRELDARVMIFLHGDEPIPTHHMTQGRVTRRREAQHQTHTHTHQVMS
jgi:hypothetical protein